MNVTKHFCGWAHLSDCRPYHYPVLAPTGQLSPRLWPRLEMSDEFSDATPPAPSP